MTRSTLLRTLLGGAVLGLLAVQIAHWKGLRHAARENHARRITHTILFSLSWHHLDLYRRGESDPLRTTAPLGTLAASASRLQPGDDPHISAGWFHDDAQALGREARDGWGRPLRLAAAYDGKLVLSSAGSDGAHGTDDDLSVDLYYRPTEAGYRPTEAGSEGDRGERREGRSGAL